MNKENIWEPSDVWGQSDCAFSKKDTLAFNYILVYPIKINLFRRIMIQLLSGFKLTQIKEKSEEKK